MLTTLGVVQVAPSSTLPALKANRGFEGKSLLEWVVRRVTDAERLNGVIVVAPAGSEGDIVAELVPPDVPLFRSSRADALGQLADALITYPCTGVVHVGNDQPFVDPYSIDQIVGRAIEYPNCDYIGYCLRDGRPTIQSSLGMFAEYFKTKALLIADREARHADDRQQVSRYLYSRPDRFAVRMIRVPSALDRHDVRLRIDTAEDWENAQQIVDALGDEHLDWQRIAGLLAQQPALRQRMAALNQSGANN